MPVKTIVRVLSGGRITIPEIIREELGMKVGSYVIVKNGGNYVEIIPAKVEARK